MQYNIHLTLTYFQENSIYFFFKHVSLYKINTINSNSNSKVSITVLSDS